MSQEEDLKRIADAFEKIVAIYEHPEEYIQRIGQQVTQTLQGTAAQMAPLPAQVGAAVVSEVAVTLAPEERKAICERAMADIEEQMTEFKGFIGQALSELPEGALKRIGELLKKGEKFKIRRRHGCIYLDFGHGDDDFYLKM